MDNWIELAYIENGRQKYRGKYKEEIAIILLKKKDSNGAWVETKPIKNEKVNTTKIKSKK